MSTGIRRLGKYELQHRLKRDSGSELWKAVDLQHQRTVALKLFSFSQPLDEEFQVRLMHEAEELASLRHSGIVPLIDFSVIPLQAKDGALAALVYLVYEYVGGQSVADYIHNTPNLAKLPPPAAIVRLFTSICLAIDYAHSHGIVHGAVQPSHILLARSLASTNHTGDPYLSDFSLPSLSSRNSISPFYLSPEQIRGQSATARSDIYSLGVVLYELCTGVLPFRGTRPVAIMMQHLDAQPTPPALLNPTVSPALASVILRSLAKEPEARFSDASSLAISLLKALKMPLPETLAQSAYALEDSHNGTNGHSVYTGFAGADLVTMTAEVRPSTPSNISGIDGARSNGSAAPKSVTPLPISPPVTPLPPSSQRKRRQSSLFIIAGLMLVLIFLGTLGSLFLMPHTAPVVPNPIVGSAFFSNSGQLTEDSAQGINDEFHLDLSRIPAPPTGKAYYCWLLNDRSQSEAAPLLLGSLVMNGGTVHFLFKGNQQHTNLLSFASRLLITLDEAKNPASDPLLNTSLWRYYAEIPQMPDPADALHFSMLDHLRHLLVESPELKIRGLHGGLAFWFVHNVSTIFNLAQSARDAWHTQDVLSIRQQAIRILDYLDGETYVQTDVPNGTPLLADKRNAQVSLLGPSPNNPGPPGYVYNNETPPGYIYLLGIHMNGAILSPQTNPDQRKLATQISTGIDQVKQWLQQIRLDAKQLLAMNAAQVLQSTTLSLLNDLQIQAQDAYTGQPDPATGQVQSGALWIYGDIQRLATLVVKVYSISN